MGSFALAALVGCGTLIAKPPSFAEAFPDPCAKEIDKVQKEWQRPPDYRGDAVSANVASTSLTWTVRDATMATSYTYTFWSGGLIGRCHTSYSTSTVRLSP
jgi:hypothetical protein